MTAEQIRARDELLSTHHDALAALGWLNRLSLDEAATAVILAGQLDAADQARLACEWSLCRQTEPGQRPFSAN